MWTTPVRTYYLRRNSISRSAFFVRCCVCQALNHTYLQINTKSDFVWMQGVIIAAQLLLIMFIPAGQAKYKVIGLACLLIIERIPWGAREHRHFEVWILWILIARLKCYFSHCGIRHNHIVNTATILFLICSFVNIGSLNLIFILSFIMDAAIKLTINKQHCNHDYL